MLWKSGYFNQGYCSAGLFEYVHSAFKILDGIIAKVVSPDGASPPATLAEFNWKEF